MNFLSKTIIVSALLLCGNLYAQRVDKPSAVDPEIAIASRNSARNFAKEKDLKSAYQELKKSNRHKNNSLGYHIELAGELIDLALFEKDRGRMENAQLLAYQALRELVSAEKKVTAENRAMDGVIHHLAAVAAEQFVGDSNIAKELNNRSQQYKTDKASKDRSIADFVYIPEGGL